VATVSKPMNEKKTCTWLRINAHGSMHTWHRAECCRIVPSAS
jgi:hypothetical protein